MKRKLFIKNVGLGIAAVFTGSISTVLAASKIPSKKLKMGSFEGSGNRIQINGKFLDAQSFENITAKIFISKKNAIFLKNDQAELSNSYTIMNDLGNAFGEKLNFKIVAEGYKTFEGQFHLNTSSVSIDSSIWQYNPAFKAENRPDKHAIENGILKANFDFHLVKK